MEFSSFFALRRVFITGAVTMIALAGSFASVQARELVTDGWFNSTVGQEARQSGSYDPTDGWMHSAVVRTASKPNDSITDGWLHSTVADPRKEFGNSRLAESTPVTDGWQHSLIGESARNTAPTTPVAASSAEFPTEIAVSSSLLALMITAGIVVLLRRRHTSIAA